MRTFGGPPSRADEVLARERDFSDAQAAVLDAATMPPREWEWGISRFEDVILDAMGDVRGMRVLDLCCGTGDLSLRLLGRNAVVTALDLSPGMVRVAEDRAAAHLPGAEAAFLAAPAENTGLPAGSFDWVVGKFALHHLDLERAAVEIHRLLRPDGRAVFVETSALSPLLGFARRRLVGRFGISRIGTADERPLDRDDLSLFARRFRHHRVDFPNFVFFELLDRHLLRFRWRWGARVLRRLDQWIEAKIPRAGRWAYSLRLQLGK